MPRLRNRRQCPSRTDEREALDHFGLLPIAILPPPRSRALPGLARGVLDRHLAQRGLPVTPAKWNPATPLLGSLDGEAGIKSNRLRAIVQRFFATTADSRRRRRDRPLLERDNNKIQLTEVLLGQ